VSDDELVVVRVPRPRTADDDLAGQVASLSQHVVDERPVHGEQQRVGIARGVGGRPGARLAFRLTREPLQLRLAACVAEDDVVAGAREDRPELAAHRARTENANSHGGARRRRFYRRSCSSLTCSIQATTGPLPLLYVRAHRRGPSKRERAALRLVPSARTGARPY